MWLDGDAPSYLHLATYYKKWKNCPVCKQKGKTEESEHSSGAGALEKLLYPQRMDDGQAVFQGILRDFCKLNEFTSFHSKDLCKGIAFPLICYSKWPQGSLHKLRQVSWDFPGGPMVKNLSCNRGHRFVPWSGN